MYLSILRKRSQLMSSLHPNLQPHLTRARSAGRSKLDWPERPRDVHESLHFDADRHERCPVPFLRTARRPRACPCLRLLRRNLCSLLLHTPAVQVSRSEGLWRLLRLPGGRHGRSRGKAGTVACRWCSGGQRRPLMGSRNQPLRSVTAVSQVQQEGSQDHNLF